MLISLQYKRTQLNNLCLYLLVITTMLGSVVYLRFAALYHFVVLGLLLLALCLGINTAQCQSNIMVFLLAWLAEAMASYLWAPDRMLALQYVYYIFLINGVCILFHVFLQKENMQTISHFMVLVLLLCNLIAFWEMRTGNHLVKDYLSTSGRLRVFKYVPGGFYWNPNDFATFIIQIIPFSFAGVHSARKVIRIVSMFNLAASFITICATQSRTQIILVLLMYVFFALLIRKRELFKMGGLVLIAVALLYYKHPDFYNMINDALDSVSGKSIVSLVALEGNSTRTRVNLLKNAGRILLDTFGFGIGAGCHRVVMPEYSAMHFNTGSIVVMHNLLGELFADYGLFVGVLFLCVITKSCRDLYRIYKKTEAKDIRTIAIMMFYTLATFVLCGASSSSILQLTSVWVTFCFSSAFIRLYR